MGKAAQGVQSGPNEKEVRRQRQVPSQPQQQLVRQPWRCHQPIAQAYPPAEEQQQVKPARAAFSGAMQAFPYFRLMAAPLLSPRWATPYTPSVMLLKLALLLLLMEDILRCFTEAAQC